jgi:hypothetical protein
VGFSVPTVSGSQLGGLLRKKIGEATGKDEPKKVEPPPAAPNAPAASNDGLNFPYPDISEPVLVGLERALETEIGLRENFKKELAAIKSPEEYNACKLQTMQSPEYLKVIEPLASIPDSAKPAERQKAMLAIGQAAEALTLKMCGPDPVQFNSGWRAKRLEEIHRKAAAAAGVVPQ